MFTRSAAAALARGTRCVAAPRQVARAGCLRNWRVSAPVGLARPSCTTVSAHLGAARSFATSGSEECLAAYPGDEGSLSHIAAMQFFKFEKQATLVSTAGFQHTIEAVAQGEATYGIVPMENSVSGELTLIKDLMMQFDVVIGGELGISEKYCLCVNPGVELADIHEIFSHKNILDACSDFIEGKMPNKAEAHPARTTTEAASNIAEHAKSDGKFAKAGAICTREAAKRFGLRILAEDIGNDKTLQTRYILLHKRDHAKDRLVPFPYEAWDYTWKQTAIFALRDEPASLMKLVSQFSLRGVNVLKVGTRPVPTGPKAPKGLPKGHQLWDYLFFVDYHVPSTFTAKEKEQLASALDEFSQWSRDFGTYPSHLPKTTKISMSHDEEIDMYCKA